MSCEYKFIMSRYQVDHVVAQQVYSVLASACWPICTPVYAEVLTDSTNEHISVFFAIDTARETLLVDSPFVQACSVRDIFYFATVAFVVSSVIVFAPGFSSTL
jgi:hypothetical protein